MMKKQKTDRTEVDASLFRDTGAHYGSLSFPLLLSTMLHVIIFTVLFFAFSASGHTPAERFPNSSVIDVSMITLPGSEPGSEFSEPADPQQEESIPEPEEPEPAGESEESEDEVSMPEPDEPKSEPEQPEVSVPEEPKAEMPEPKTPEPTPEPKKLPEPVRRSEKKSEKSAKPVKHKARDKRIANSKKLRSKTVAIDRLKQKHGEKKKSGNGKKAVKEDNGNTGNGQGTGNARGNRAGSGRTSAAIRYYKDNVIPNRVNSNWALSEHLLNRRFGLRAVLVIKIMPNGFISDMWFEKTSGDNYFDDTVKKAVMKSNPLDSLPRDFSEPFYEVELEFTPSGLN